METVTIKSVLENVFHGLESSRQKKEEVVLAAWQEAVGEKAFLHTTILSLRKRTLVVGVDSSPWLYLLSVYKQSILKKMKPLLQELPPDLIGQIQFKTIGKGELINGN